MLLSRQALFCFHQLAVRKDRRADYSRNHITLNKNCVPNETRSPQQTSGVRIGTAAMTTKGYTEEDFIAVAHEIDRVIKTMQMEKLAYTQEG